ncbi:MAG: hypothetical protein FWG46_04800 [Treponema sp.]|nr:hypothetical protein [Treponema sp.]
MVKVKWHLTPILKKCQEFENGVKRREETAAAVMDTENAGKPHNLGETPISFVKNCRENGKT